MTFISAKFLGRSVTESTRSSCLNSHRCGHVMTLGKGEQQTAEGRQRQAESEGTGRGEIGGQISQPRCSPLRVQLKPTHLSLRCSILPMHCEQ